MRRPASLFAATSALLATAACGSGTFTEITGTVAGVKLNPTTYYWGGPFLVFTNLEQDCKDMAWVERGPFFENGGEAPVSDDMVALLFTFEDTDVTGGTNVSLKGESAVDARLLVVESDALTVYKAKEGEFIVDEAEEGDHALGSFALSFDDGTLTGDYEVEWCTNLKTPY